MCLLVEILDRKVQISRINNRSVPLEGEEHEDNGPGRIRFTLPVTSGASRGRPGVDYSGDRRRREAVASLRCQAVIRVTASGVNHQCAREDGRLSPGPAG